MKMKSLLLLGSVLLLLTPGISARASAATSTVILEGRLLDTNGSSTSGGWDDNRVTANAQGINVTPGQPYQFITPVGNTVHSIGPAGAPDDGWTLYGYTICDQHPDGAWYCGRGGSGGQQADYASWVNNPNNAYGSSTMTFDAIAGHRYNVRWFYKKDAPAPAPASAPTPGPTPSSAGSGTPTSSATNGSSTPASTQSNSARATHNTPVAAASTTPTAPAADASNATDAATTDTSQATDSGAGATTATSSAPTADKKSEVAAKPSSNKGGIIGVLLVAVLIAAGIFIYRRRRAQTVPVDYGPPLDTVSDTGYPFNTAGIPPVVPPPLQLPTIPTDLHLQQHTADTIYPWQAENPSASTPHVDEPQDMYELAREHPESFGSAGYAEQTPSSQPDEATSESVELSRASAAVPASQLHAQPYQPSSANE